MKKLIIAGITLCFVHSAFAYEPDRAKTNQAHELAECAAFYLLGSEAVRRNGAKELANTLKQSATLAMLLSKGLSNKDVLQARIEMAVDEQKKMMNNDFSNVSILLHKYKDVCKSAVEHPDIRYRYWLDK